MTRSCTGYSHNLAAQLAICSHVCDADADFSSAYGDDAAGKRFHDRRVSDAQSTQAILRWELEKLDAMLQGDATCALCAMVVPNVVRCNTCTLTGVLMCPACDHDAHAVPHFHERAHFLEGYAKPLGPCHFLSSDGSTPEVKGIFDAAHARTLVFVASADLLLSDAHGSAALKSH